MSQRATITVPVSGRDRDGDGGSTL